MEIVRKAVVVSLGNISLWYRRNLKLFFPNKHIIAIQSLKQ